MTSAHLVSCYLPRTENWLYRRLSGLQRYPPLVFADSRVNEAEFDLPGIHSFERLPVWRRALYRLPVGPFEVEARNSNFYWREMVRSDCRVLHSHFATVAHRHENLRRHSRATLNCATVTSFYGNDLRTLTDEYNTIDTRRLMEEETGFVVEGEHMGERLIAAGCSPEKIYVNALGVDLSLFPERPEQELADECRVLTVGRFVEKKGIPDAIRAVAMARRSGVLVRLTIIGDGTLRTLVESIIASEQAGAFVELAGNVNYSQLIDSYYKHDILLQPSVTATDGDTEGGAPVSITEGMAAGLPVVATRHADIPNVVREGYNALLADERQPQKLAEALCELCSDIELRRSFAQGSRQRALDFFDSRKQSKALEDIYDSLVKS